MMRNQWAVPMVWRTGKFVVVEKDLVDADKIYDGIGKRAERMRKQVDKGTLDSFWKTHGDRVEQLKDAFRDDSVLEALKGKLEEGRITDGDIQTLVNGGGMKMEED
jgi:hypothetical protein